MAEKAKADQRAAERASWLAQAAALFEVDPPASGDKLYLSRFLAARGEVSVSGPYTDGDPARMSLELHGLTPEAGLVMLKALAGHQLTSARCCYTYGPGHDERLSLLGCLRQHRDGPASYAESEALFDLFAKTSGGTWAEWLGDIEVHEAWRGLGNE